MALDRQEQQIMDEKKISGIVEDGKVSPVSGAQSLDEVRWTEEEEKQLVSFLGATLASPFADPIQGSQNRSFSYAAFDICLLCSTARQRCVDQVSNGKTISLTFGQVTSATLSQTTSWRTSASAKANSTSASNCSLSGSFYGRFPVTWSCTASDPRYGLQVKSSHGEW